MSTQPICHGRFHFLGIQFPFVASVLLLLAGCGEDFCSKASDKAESCGVNDLEIEDDAAGCSDDTAQCRASCIDDAPCDEIEASFAGGSDRTTEAWLCYEACGI